MNIEVTNYYGSLHLCVHTSVMTVLPPQVILSLEYLQSNIQYQLYKTTEANILTILVLGQIINNLMSMNYYFLVMGHRISNCPARILISWGLNQVCNVDVHLYLVTTKTNKALETPFCFSCMLKIVAAILVQLASTSIDLSSSMAGNMDFVLEFIHIFNHLLPYAIIMVIFFC